MAVTVVVREVVARAASAAKAKVAAATAEAATARSPHRPEATAAGSEVVGKAVVEWEAEVMAVVAKGEALEGGLGVEARAAVVTAQVAQCRTCM